jgi:uncharacterized protein (TIGR01777 family)
MRVFMTGATGMIGRDLALRLQCEGHEVIAWVRDVAAARQVLGAGPELLPVAESDARLAEVLSRADAVINLAGAPVAQRWTARHRRRLVESRVDVTQRIVAAMAVASPRPRVLVSTSAIGWYGDRGAAELDEGSAVGEGFLAELSQRWEAAADEAAPLGVRVVKLRLGVVLAAEGGALARLVPATRWGGGVIIGDGRQFMSWIHLRDVVGMYMQALADPRWSGVYNATAPHPVDNGQFTRRLARALHRPTWMKVPAVALRLALGEMAQIVTASQRVTPRRALAADFSFRFPELGAALAEVLQPVGRDVQFESVSEVPPDVAYFADHRPKYRLRQTVVLDAPIDRVFDFFRRAENLGAMTPDDMSFDIQTPTPIAMHEGTRIEYAIRLGPVPLRWLTRIERWAPDRCFVDAQYAGPYAAWYHEHHFEAVGDDRTKMTDVVWYAPPLGPLGRLANRLFITGKLRGIFGHRTRVIRKRFGIVASDADARHQGDEAAAA